MLIGVVWPPLYRFHEVCHFKFGTYATRVPSGENQASSARHIGSTSGQPPSIPTVYSRSKSAYASRAERNSTFFPSGVHPSAMSGPGCHVSRRGSPPSAGTTNTSKFPSYSPVNAIQLPSGENIGSPSWPPVVSCRASPPSRGTLHKYPPYANTIWVLLSVGACASDGDSSAAAASPARHTTMHTTTAIRIAIRLYIYPPIQNLYSHRYIRNSQRFINKEVG